MSDLRDQRLFGYTTEENFKKFVKIMKSEKLSQSALLHLLVERMVNAWDGSIAKVKYKKQGAPTKPKELKTHEPFKTKRVMRY